MPGKETYEAEYPFVKKNIFLKVLVDSDGQKLIISMKDEETGEIIKQESLTCIHTAVLRLPAKELIEKMY